MKNGRGIKVNEFLACEYYYQALEMGYFEAKEDLDKLLNYDGVKAF